MKTFLFSISFTIFATVVLGQEIPASKLINLPSLPLPKAESFLKSNSFAFSGSEVLRDTVFKSYEFRADRKNKSGHDATIRSIVVANCKDQYEVTYHTSSRIEYLRIIAELKKTGYQCDYEKDEKLQPAFYVYQSGNRTAEVCIKQSEGRTCHCIKLHRQEMPDTKALQDADDLMKFTSHEYLAHYFGEKNIQKDLYYFAKNDIVNCSVLFINTSRQVIFVWKDALNRRQISSLIFGGQNKLKSQDAAATTPIQNQWKLKNGLRPGMHLVELRKLNDKEIIFCGGNAPNPGLILPESTGIINFENADVILSCVNCTDEKFKASQMLQSDAELREGRMLFVLSIVLYPVGQ